MNPLDDTTGTNHPTQRLCLRKPALILVMGVPGSGKSTLARAVLQNLVCVYLDNNFVADAFFADTRTKPSYAELRPRLYEVTYRITRENLAVGNTVLLDVPHITHVQSEDWRAFIQELAEGSRATLVVIRCRVDENTLRQRLQDRGEPRDAWKLANWSEFLSREPIDVFIPFRHLEVDTSRDSEGILNEVMRYIVDCVESQT